MIVTLFTAGFCGLLYFVLGIRVVRLRVAHGISLGHDGNDILNARIRAHANFAECVPFILILMGLIENQAGPGRRILAAIGILVVVVRLSHVVGMARPSPNPFRVAGAAGTYLILVGLSLWAIVLALGSV